MPFKLLVITHPNLEGRRLPGPDPAQIKLLLLPFPQSHSKKQLQICPVPAGAGTGITLVQGLCRARDVPGPSGLCSCGEGDFSRAEPGISPVPKSSISVRKEIFSRAGVVFRHEKEASRGWEHPRASLSRQTLRC